VNFKEARKKNNRMASRTPKPTVPVSNVLKQYKKMINNSSGPDAKTLAARAANKRKKD
jgi:hypothetical protein